MKFWEYSSCNKKGNKLSKKHREAISHAMKGNKNQQKKGWKWPKEKKFKLFGRIVPNREKGQFKLGHPTWNQGKKMPNSMREKMQKIASERIGEKSPNWCGGLSFLPYLPAFNRKLKETIKERDGYECKLCLIMESNHYEKLSIHHIDYDKTNNNPLNLITLCRACNSKVNFQREKWNIHFSQMIFQNTNAS